MSVAAPHGWPIKRLRFVTQRRVTEEQSNLLGTASEVTFLPMEAIGERGQLDLTNVRNIEDVRSGYTQFFDGDVLVAKITPCFENGKGALVRGTLRGVGCGTTELHVLTPGPEVDGRFLYFITASEPFRKLGEASMTGAAGQKRVPEDYVRDFRVAVPTIHEQLAIVDYLDRETARIDGLIAAKQRLLDLLAEKRRALITRAVTRGLDPSVPLRDSGIPWFGEIPKHWSVIRLKYVADLKSGDGITSEDIAERGKYPVFGGNGIRGFTSSFTHDGQHVLIGRQGALCGNVHLASGRFRASEHAIVATVKRGEDATWLCELLRVMNLNQYSESAAQPGLAVDFVGNLHIPVPPVVEQRAIADHIVVHANNLDAVRTATERTIALLKERRAALIAAAVTGQIHVQGAGRQIEAMAKSQNRVMI